jgi:hypothetical protein
MDNASWALRSSLNFIGKGLAPNAPTPFAADQVRAGIKECQADNGR